jgi:hypothetical protein
MKPSRLTVQELEEIAHGENNKLADKARRELERRNQRSAFFRGTLVDWLMLLLTLISIGFLIGFWSRPLIKNQSEERVSPRKTQKNTIEPITLHNQR